MLFRSYRVGATSTGSAGTSVRILAGTTDVTSAVLAGGWAAAPLDPGGSLVLTVRIGVARSAPAKAKRTVVVSVGGTGDPAVIDAVKAVTKR